jgi:Arc/MetJ-type ribon-helix-helix transcriptional regulator
MSSTTPDEEDPEIEQITLKLTKTLLEQVDDQWREQGFPNRSEYIRHVLHDAVTTPELDRDELLAIALGERELRRDPDAALTREAARELANEDE